MYICIAIVLATIQGAFHTSIDLSPQIFFYLYKSVFMVLRRMVMLHFRNIACGSTTSDDPSVSMPVCTSISMSSDGGESVCRLLVLEYVYVKVLFSAR